MNHFSKCLDVGDEQIQCLDKYSKPTFFFQEWLKEEQRKYKLLKEKKRKKRKRKGKKRSTMKKKTTLVALERTYVDDFGNTYTK